MRGFLPQLVHRSIGPSVHVNLDTGQWQIISLQMSIDEREGASGASADAPGVGLEIVSVLKLIEKDKNQ